MCDDNSNSKGEEKMVLEARQKEWMRKKISKQFILITK